jgi:uncharacterized damage-inducible protein DinB
MDNLKYIKKLLNDHFNGEPWIDVNTANTLKNTSASEAAEKTLGLNSIWQIASHMISWRLALLARLKDKPVNVPDNNFIEDVKDTSDVAWADTIKKFESSQQEILTFLENSDNAMLEKVSPSSGYSYYELAISIMLHNTYHLGQIVLIKKILSEK